MIKRWLLYLAALVAATVFFAAHQHRLSWFVLTLTALLPLLSLILTLIPALLARPVLQCPTVLTLGSKQKLELKLHSPFPLPSLRCTFRARHTLLNTNAMLLPEENLPTEHCGALICTGTALHCYDFLGLFRLRLRKYPSLRILVRPVERPVQLPRDLERFLARSWKPKYGGGYAENHDLRLYRPGDSLNQVHWKMSAKAGKLMVREPLVPRLGKVVLSIELNGGPEELDTKLGRLLWCGRHLLELGLQYELHALTGSGPSVLHVTDEQTLQQSIDTLLCASAAPDGVHLPYCRADWQYHIGGEPDEA